MKKIITFSLFACLASATVVQGGEKAIINKTSSQVTFSALTRVGDDPDHSGPTVSIPVKPKGSAPLNYKQQFLNGVTVSWQGDGANSDQFQQVTTRGSAWDNVMNTNEALTINAVKPLDATGSNTGVSSAGQGAKKIVNKSKQDLSVYLVTRSGDDPSGHGPTVGPIHIKSGGSALIPYPGPFLNAISVNWFDSGSHGSQATTVTKRGSAWDSTLNTNDTVTINSVSGPAITGSN